MLKRLTTKEYISGILNSDRSVLSRAITLIESSNLKDREVADNILNEFATKAGHSIRIGITGVPGVGKSTFIESFGKIVTEDGHKLAVLAIDPVSKKSGGSILGDKTRMDELARNPNAFIRPSSAGDALGGISHNTRSAILLCETAGFDVIIVETVGVGQSEIAVSELVDFFLLLMIAGAGDELQGLKRGIMEMADHIAITKADGNNIKATNQARATYLNAAHLFPLSDSGWTTKVTTCSAHENEGLGEIWQSINEYAKHTQSNGFFDENRRQQAVSWFHEGIESRLVSEFYQKDGVSKAISNLEKQVIEQTTHPQAAINQLFKTHSE